MNYKPDLGKLDDIVIASKSINYILFRIFINYIIYHIVLIINILYYTY
jgi:hypothetical protein